MGNATDKNLVVVAWSAVFDLLGVTYQQRPVTQRIELPKPRGEITGETIVYQYTPDFFVPSLQAFVDVRAFVLSHDEVLCGAHIADRTGYPLFAFGEIFVPTRESPFQVQVILGKGHRVMKPRYLCANYSRCWVDTTHNWEDTIHPRLTDALAFGTQLLS